MKPPAERSAGFSLVETLIGLTLTALIAASVMGAVRTSTQIFSKVEANTEHRERARILQLASSWLERAVSDRIMNTEPGTVFSGEETSVNFVVTGLSGPSQGGLSRLEFARAASATCPGAFDLRLTWSKVMPDYAYSSYDPVTRTLLSCQDEVQFAYFGSIEPETEPAWVTTWPKSADLPKIVAVNSRGGDGTHQMLTRLQFSGRPVLARRPGRPETD